MFTHVNMNDPRQSSEARLHAFTGVNTVLKSAAQLAALLRKWSMMVRMASCLRRGRLSIRSSRWRILRLGLGGIAATATGLAVRSNS